ncbi:NEDD8 ultimate buster 1-like isoform X3 [Panicum virgatum]|uniref:NEDD8 ultimate buster 1-like isoform X3 n=1 Tax=Panicum virgatum TaxID=38727 RepID=UPI0019D5E8C5|nr:NEDD8 ultimate buster 1-like isoform X3 [Panicum virgatum]
MASDEAPKPAADRIRVVGKWVGALEVDLGAWTAPMLRAEVARRVGGGVEPERVGLIFGGRVLKDDPPASLLEAGLKANAKVLSSLASPDRAKEIAAEAAKAKAEEEHAARLVRLWDAAKAMSQRHTDGSFLEDEDYNLDLEDQSGQKVMFGSVDDMKALKMALMLHQKGKTQMKKKKYKEALDVLIMAEEAFSLCDSKLIQKVDNMPMLQLDIVWCYFVLRDVSCLEVAGTRLEKARVGFERSHGKDSSRFRVLQAGRQADLAIYVRLELLEGVVAYHNGHTEKARESLTSAQAKYLQLQVPDEAISMLMDMGYEARSAKRALKMTGYDIQSSVDLLCEEREKKIRRQEEDRERQREILEQMRYGKTPMNKAVDLQKLKDLTNIGFEKYLAAEALRINENDAEKALDLLTNPEENCILQNKIQARRSRATRGSSSSRAAAARTARAINNRQAFVSAPPHAVDGNAPPHAANGNPQEGNQADGNLPEGNDVDSKPPEGNDVDSKPPEGNDVDGNPPEGNNVDDNPQEGNQDVVMTDEVAVNDEDTNSIPVPARDVSMESELADELTGDALDDYDIEVSDEGQAIAEYMSLLESVASS